MLSRIFGSKREEVGGGYRKLQKGELHNLYASPNIIRVIKSRRKRWAADVIRMEEMKNAYKILGKKLEEKKPLGRPIRIDMREIGWEGVD
jgi:hypothetical protein